jgi:hypothetical protein
MSPTAVRLLRPHGRPDMTQQANAVVYRLSEFGELAQRIAAIRDEGKARREYQAALRAYNRRRRGRAESTWPDEGRFWGGGRITGFKVTHMGQELSFPRPERHERNVYARWSGKDGGMLAYGGKYNRPISAERVADYQRTMEAGLWHDLLTDPISITSDGEVINGQHRFAAGSEVTLKDGDPDPSFLVLFDVSRAEVAFTDTSKRTGRDTTIVAQKAVAVA